MSGRLSDSHFQCKMLQLVEETSASSEQTNSDLVRFWEYFGIKQELPVVDKRLS